MREAPTKFDRETCWGFVVLIIMALCIFGAIHKASEPPTPARYLPDTLRHN